MFAHEELTPEEQATVDGLKKLLPYVLADLQGGIKIPAGFGKLNVHDLKVLAFYIVVATIQTYLIGAKIEYPMYAPAIQWAAEFLRRLVY